MQSKIAHLDEKRYQANMKELAMLMLDILHNEPPDQAVVKIIECVDEILKGRRAEDLIVDSHEERRKIVRE